ncbi:MAG: hypothetical protein AAF632_20715 [Bacteroidota bacterium]
MLKSLLLILLMIGFATASFAQELPSVAIRTDSGRDSLIFRVRLDGQTWFRVYFEDHLYADLPPFKEKHFAIEPQRDWSCIGMRETQKAFEVIIFANCEKARFAGLSKLYQAEDIPNI